MTVIYGSFGHKMATKYLHYGFTEKANAPSDVSNSILQERGADCARMRVRQRRSVRHLQYSYGPASGLHR